MSITALDIVNLWQLAEQSRRLFRYNEDGSSRDLALEAAILADGFHPAGNQQSFISGAEGESADYQLAFHLDGRDRVYTLGADGLISWFERPAISWYTEKVDLFAYLVAPEGEEPALTVLVYGGGRQWGDRELTVAGNRGVSPFGEVGNYYTTIAHAARQGQVAEEQRWYFGFTATADRLVLTYDSLFHEKPMSFQAYFGPDFEEPGLPRYVGLGDSLSWPCWVVGSDGSRDGYIEVRVTGRWHQYGNDLKFYDVLSLEWNFAGGGGLDDCRVVTHFARNIGLIGWHVPHSDIWAFHKEIRGLPWDGIDDEG